MFLIRKYSVVISWKSYNEQEIKNFGMSNSKDCLNQSHRKIEVFSLKLE